MKKSIIGLAAMSAFALLGAQAQAATILTNGFGSCGRSPSSSCFLTLSDGSYFSYDPVNKWAIFDGHVYNTYAGSQSSGTFSGTDASGHSFSAQVTEAVYSYYSRGGGGRGGGGAGTHYATSGGSVTVSYGSTTTTPLSAPTGLAGTPSQTSIALHWAGSIGGIAPITYTVMRNGVAEGTTTATSFTDTGLAASTTYSYVVQATDSTTPTSGMASSAAISVTTLTNTGGGGGGGGGGLTGGGDDGGHDDGGHGGSGSGAESGDD